MAKLELVTFTVEGCLQFPFDMLRYDSCWPYTGEDAAQLDRRHDRDVNIQSRRVVLQGIQSPTKDRWASFNWRVVADGVDRERVTKGDQPVDCK